MRIDLETDIELEIDTLHLFLEHYTNWCGLRIVGKGKITDLDFTTKNKNDGYIAVWTNNLMNLDKKLIDADVIEPKPVYYLPWGYVQIPVHQLSKRILKIAKKNLFQIKGEK